MEKVRLAMSTEKRVACIGCGVVGGAWAGLFASRGLSVNAYDPSAEAESTLRRTVRQAMAYSNVPDRDVPRVVHFTTVLEEAVAGVDFVQESAPEHFETKRDLYSTLDNLVPPSVPIASSTSGLPISELQVGCTHPERLVVGHPINPPYAVELVEVVGGARTSQKTIDRVIAFYRSVGRRPVRLDEEVFGFVANRLQMALVREALQLIMRGQASIEQIDHILMYGIGVRWSAVGVFGAYLLNTPECEASDWLTHLESVNFGAQLVHDGDFSGWNSDLKRRISEQWRARTGLAGGEGIRRERDQMVAAINQLRQLNDPNQ